MNTLPEDYRKMMEQAGIDLADPMYEEIVASEMPPYQKALYCALKYACSNFSTRQLKNLEKHLVALSHEYIGVKNKVAANC